MCTARRLVRLALLLGFAALLAVPPAGASPDDGFVDTGRGFTATVTGRTWRVLRDPATGDRAFEAPDGTRVDSVEALVRHEERGVDAVRLVLDPLLHAAAFDAARAAEPVRAVLLHRVQPVHDLAPEFREVARRAAEPRLARLRAVLDRIAPLRADDPERSLQLGDRLAEEARLLTPEEREELVDLRRALDADLDAARRDLLERAAPVADAARAGLEQRVVALGGRVLAHSVGLHTLSVEVPAGALRDLARDPDVRRVLALRTSFTGLNTSVSSVGAATWHGAGYDGSSSAKVAIMDTGIDSTHPALANRVAEEAVFLQAAKDHPAFNDDATSHDDFHFHGTHVGGIAMSDDTTYAGVAPGGTLMDAKAGWLTTSNQGAFFDPDMFEAMDWAATNGADALNASLGGGGTTNASSGIALAFEALVDDLGLSAAVSAGNSGSAAGTVGIPGDAYNVVTVGSFDDKGTVTHADNVVSGFSSRGPLDDGRRKPDLSAPGTAITSSYAHWEGATTDWVSANGTSMSAPHVAGAMGLLYDYAASWRPEGVKALLCGTTRIGTPYPTTPDNDWGTGAMDLANAFTHRATVREGTLTSSGPGFVLLRAGTMGTGKRATLVWNREVIANGDDAPVTYRAAADLDLYVYEESDESARGSSTTALDNVEQVALTSSSTFPILKVVLAGAMPTGQTEVRWAVATEGGTSTQIVSPPELRGSFSSVPSAVRGAEEMIVEVTITNDGETPATSPDVSLTLPEGYTLVSGDNPQTLVTIPVANARTATWTVRSDDGATGTRTFAVDATTTSFEETLDAPTVEFEQVLDTVAPTGAVTIAAGAAAVGNPSVSLRVPAFDDRSGVADMRVRNAGGAWSAWKPWTFESDWTLVATEGVNAVEVQVRDAVGNESAVLDDDVLLDMTPPTGTFVLSGDAEYLMPWQDLVADTLAEDGEGGAGLANLRVRWNGSTTWGNWLPMEGSSVPLARPSATEGLLCEAQFQDAAGNHSENATDRIHLVPDTPPSLGAVKVWSGTLTSGGDVDAFTLDLVDGDRLTLKVKGKSAVRKGVLDPAVDLWSPSEEAVVTGRWPAAARKAGISKFAVTETGRWWVVLRAEGTDRAEGGVAALGVKVKPAKASRGGKGLGLPLDGTVELPFEAVDGALLTAVLKGDGLDALTLRAPSGAATEFAFLAPSKSLKVQGHELDETGLWTLVVPTHAPVKWKLKVKRPKGGKVFEGGD